MEEKAELEVFTNTSIVPTIPDPILILFKNYIEQGRYTELYEAILNHPRLNQYAKQVCMNSFWDKLLIEERILMKGIPLRRQKTLESFYVIMGFYIFSKKINYKNLASTQSQAFIKRGIDEYHSFYCLNVKLTHLLRRQTNQASPEFITNILDTVRLNLPQYLSARYLLIAFICYKYTRRDPLLIQDCLTAVILAKKLEKYSFNELHNAFFGESLLFSFNTIDDILNHLVQHFRINTEQMAKAEKSAELSFQVLKMSKHLDDPDTLQKLPLDEEVQLQLKEEHMLIETVVSFSS